MADIEDTTLDEWEYSTIDDIIYLNQYVGSVGVNFIETIYHSFQFKILNPQGDEEIIKLTGELPEGVEFSNGLIYGIVPIGLDKNTYEIEIAVRRNNEILTYTDEEGIEHQLIQKVKIGITDITTINVPIWITNSGIIKKFNYLDNVESTFIKAYDPHNRTITYEIVEGADNLPDGIEFNTQTGYFSGTCKTKFAQNWAITCVAKVDDTYIDDEGVEQPCVSEERTFILATNLIDSDDSIEWVTKTLDNAQIGYDYIQQLKVSAKTKVKFMLTKGSLPEGLQLSESGYIKGFVDSQTLGDYNFTIMAITDKTYKEQEFTITVLKGLGKYSVNAYLYINNEYLNEYEDLRSHFSVDSAYMIESNKYKISNKPKIDVCQCSTFDYILMRYLLDKPNTPVEVEVDKTERIDTDDYSIFYKSLNERHSTSEKYDIGKHEYKKIYVSETIKYYYAEDESVEVTPPGTVYEERVYENDRVCIKYYYLNAEDEKIYVIKKFIYTRLDTGEIVTPDNVFRDNNVTKSYIVVNDKKIYVEELSTNRYYIKSTKEVIGVNEQIFKNTELGLYVLRNDIKMPIVKADNNMLMDLSTGLIVNYTAKDTQIKTENSYALYYVEYNGYQTIQTTSIDWLREQLTTKIYVNKKEGEVYYKKGNQEIINIDELKYKHFIVKWDEENQTYYVEHSGERKRFCLYAKDNNSTEDVYKKVYIEAEAIYDCGDATPKTNTDDYDNGYASTTNFDLYIGSKDYTETMFKEVYMMETYYNSDVDYRYYFVYDKETFEEQDDVIFSLDWDSTKKFILHNGCYYMVSSIENPYVYYANNNIDLGFTKDIVLPYVTDDDIETDDKGNYIQFLNIDDENLPEWKDSYYPTLDLFYSKPHKNVVALSEINKLEDDGEYHTNRKLLFYEIHFEQIFNNNIDNFTIDYYNHNNENSPEFQLI